ncbi:MAG: molybdopterin-guanine dinucleotide biosynthesis protein B [Gracilibacteraceae bacterium]|jgi:molybdopterin-guanine dinucleotide biosynthesis protein B|nr:molybdopterin-guanine dinucleotide biosynthesis protein B [Gracilibacteraceae bacterium]
MSGVPALSIVAAVSGTGKTTLLEKLIAELTRRGLRVGAVKNDAHRFQIDHAGKDTWRFTQAGARATAIVSGEQYALIQKTETRKDLLAVLELLEDVDIILVEGFKAGPLPRIEVVRRARGDAIVSDRDLLLAVATDIPDLTADKPCFALDDAAGIAEFIIARFISPSVPRFSPPPQP